jgi:uncharacterized protein (TIGR02246 family)
MRRYLAGVSLASVLLAGAFRANAQEPARQDKNRGKENAVSELEQMIQRWYQAWLDKDAATVERLMADDYVYVAPTGQAQDRAAILRIIRSPNYRLHHFTRSNVVVRMLGDHAAVIRARGQGEGEFEGKPFKQDQACMTVCARVDGHWRVVVEQCTDMKP